MINDRLFSFLSVLVILGSSFEGRGEKAEIYCEISGPSGIVSNRLGASTIEVVWDKVSGSYLTSEYESISQRCAIQMESDDHVDLSLKPALTASVSGGRKYPLGSSLIENRYQRMIREDYPHIKREKDNTLVILFHGTGSNPTDLKHSAYPSYEEDFNVTQGGGELLSWLRHKMIQLGATPNQDVLSIHGVGSGNLQITNLHDSFTATQTYGDARGKAVGSGTTENIRHALFHLRGETKNPALKEEMLRIGPYLKSVGKVIVIGWSRGGVTGIQFASEMNADSDLKTIDIHMLSIDPVPGLGNISLGLWSNIAYIHSNVKQFTGIYAQNERSYGFTAIIPYALNKKGKFAKDDLKRKLIMELPGNHASLVGNVYTSKDREKGRTDPAIIASARIVRALAQSYIVQNGGCLEEIQYRLGQDVSRKEVASLMIQDFDFILQNTEVFKQMEKESYTGVNQLLGSNRKYHQEASYTGFKVLDLIPKMLTPRSVSSSVKGFLIKENNDHHDKKQLWVSHFHHWLALLQKNQSLDELNGKEGFNPLGYYEKLKVLVKHDTSL